MSGRSQVAIKINISYSKKKKKEKRTSQPVREKFSFEFDFVSRPFVARQAHTEAVHADWKEYLNLLICEENHLKRMDEYHKVRHQCG